MTNYKNLQRPAKGVKKGRRQANPAKQEIFCVRYYLTGSAERAAVEAGYRASYAYELLHKPEVQERLQIIKEKFRDESIKPAVRQKLINEDLLDAYLMDVIRHGGDHPTRGQADRLNAIALGLKKLHLIGSPQQTASPSDLPEGGFMRDMYKAKWLRDKEAALAKEFEEEAEAEKRAAQNGNGTNGNSANGNRTG